MADSTSAIIASGRRESGRLSRPPAHPNDRPEYLQCQAIPSGIRSSTRRVLPTPSAAICLRGSSRSSPWLLGDGGGDPDSNPRLRTVIADAKAANMPAENIKRAIRRGTGEEPGVSYEEVSYEAYGPGGAALLIEVLTDNTNRAVGEIRHLLSKHGGNLGAANSVAWMFDKRSYIVIEKVGTGEEALMMAAIDAGADDFREDEDNWEVVSAPEAHEQVLTAVKEAGAEPASAQVAMLPQNFVKLEGKTAQQMIKLMEVLEESRRRAARLVQLRY